MRIGKRGPALLLFVLLLPVGCWVFYEAQRELRADVASVATRKRVAVWVSGAAAPASDAEWQTAHADLTQAIAITPDNAALYEVLGQLYVVAGQQVWADPVKRRPHFEKAIVQFRKAIELRPGESQTWAALAQSYAAIGEYAEPMQQAWAKALALGPNEGHVQPMLMQVVLQVWDDATPAMQQWARLLFERADPATRQAINKLAQSYGMQFVDDGRQPSRQESSPPSTGDAESPVAAKVPR